MIQIRGQQILTTISLHLFLGVLCFYISESFLCDHNTPTGADYFYYFELNVLGKKKHSVMYIPSNTGFVFFLNNL